jgi:nitrite reductase/ring-hydroxylating ferredoxin subunit
MTSRVSVGPSDRFGEGQAVRVDAAGTSLLVTRLEGQLHAVRNRCTHLPVPLDRGKVEDGTVVCPLHNSRFDLCTGQNLEWVTGVAGVKVPKVASRIISLGASPRDLATYEVVEEDGQVFVTL